MRSRRPIVIVGAGIAGITTALSAGPRPVQVLCRSHDGGDSASALAQGGIAAAIDTNDSIDDHISDTLAVGANYNDGAVVRWLCENAPSGIGWLSSLGVAFDRDLSGRLQLGKEGGHQAARVVHAGGDASGAEIMRTLRTRAKYAPHIQWRSGLDADALLLRNGHVCAVRVRDARGQLKEIEASAVVLATGGIGGLFAHTSNPASADGSGLALGMAAGALARDLEFVQFHPTALDVTGGHCLPLITEALRGAGARLRDVSGRLLMDGVHPQGDLAPRDVVARRVWRSHNESGRVWLDTSAVKGDWVRNFPTVLRTCLSHGFDPRHEWIPVAPAAHFHMGGLATDMDGRTTVPGLYAVGEVACNGVHGANRLASNSLLEGLLCGRRLGQYLARSLEDAPNGRHCWSDRGEPLLMPSLAKLRERMWDAAGPIREEIALVQALRENFEWSCTAWQARLAQQILTSALERRASLGSHYRRDTASYEMS